ncbi:hypothetical protein HK405_015839, partial [Cladochytrium tenue]
MRSMASRLPAWRRFSTTAPSTPLSSTPDGSDFTHAVIGGGVVGLAVARELARRSPGAATVVLERHGAVGTETSSRNSEVIHAGLYYGPGSLKSQLCIRGKDLLYDFCRAAGVAHRRTGKWIVAQTAAEREELERLHAFCARSDVAVPLRWVGRDEAARREPAVRADAGILESTTTGIVDSHGLMQALLGEFDAAGGTLALWTAVELLEPAESAGTPGSAGWRLHLRDSRSGARFALTADTVVNAAGLGAVDIHNSVVPPPRRLKSHFAKGNYFAYTGAAPRVSTLVYPAPTPGAHGLGTHLTLDLAGRLRFGPDVEWVDSPDDLVPNPARLPAAAAEIRRYLPGVDARMLVPDYAGIRPKLAQGGAVVQGAGFVDFVVREEAGFKGFVNLLGIESPGLTSSLAIAER